MCSRVTLADDAVQEHTIEHNQKVQLFISVGVWQPEQARLNYEARESSEDAE
jgi:hypothetical protein